EDQELRAAGIRTSEDLIMLREVAVERVIPRIRTEVRIQQRERVDIFEGCQLHSPEKLISYEGAERAHVAGEALRSRRDNRLFVGTMQIDDAVVGAGAQLLPLIQK